MTPVLDQAMSALCSDFQAKGLLHQTLVVSAAHSASRTTTSGTPTTKLSFGVPAGWERDQRSERSRTRR